MKVALHKITSPLYTSRETRDLLFPHLGALVKLLEDEDCHQLPQLEIDYNLIEVSKDSY